MLCTSWLMDILEISRDLTWRDRVSARDPPDLKKDKLFGIRSTFTIRPNTASNPISASHWPGAGCSDDDLNFVASNRGQVSRVVWGFWLTRCLSADPIVKVGELIIFVTCPFSLAPAPASRTSFNKYLLELLHYILGGCQPPPTLTKTLLSPLSTQTQTFHDLLSLRHTHTECSLFYSRCIWRLICLHSMEIRFVLTIVFNIYFKSRSGNLRRPEGLSESAGLSLHLEDVTALPCIAHHSTLNDPIGSKK